MDPQLIFKMLNDHTNCSCKRGCITGYKFDVKAIADFRRTLASQPKAVNVKQELANRIQQNLATESKTPWMVNGIPVCPRFFVRATASARRVCYSARKMAMSKRMFAMDRRSYTNGLRRSKHGKYSKALAFWTWYLSSFFLSTYLCLPCRNLLSSSFVSGGSSRPLPSPTQS